MLPESYRRLWRRRLRRRPLLPFLLAATVAVVASSSFAEAYNPIPSDPWLASVGGTVALLGLGGVWITNRFARMAWRLAACGLFLLAFGWLLPLDSDYQSTATFGLVVMVISALLGAAIRRVLGRSPRGLRRRKRLSIASLLVLTTVTAIAIVGYQNLNQDVLLALTTDPQITGYMLSEALTAPIILAIAMLCRSTATAIVITAASTTTLLLLYDLTILNDQMPAIWDPPHYYHLGLVAMTAVWLLSMRSQPPALANDHPVSKDLDAHSPIVDAATSIDLRG